MLPRYYDTCSFENPNEEQKLTDSQDFTMIKTMIANQRKNIWDRIQEKMKTLIMSRDLSNMKIEKYLQVFYAVSMVWQFYCDS